MRIAVRSPLTTFIACALYAGTGLAQESGAGKPTLYTTVDENEIYLEVGEEVIDLETGQSAVVDANGARFIDRAPDFLNWPCGTSYAMGRGSLETYSIADLPAEGRVNEVIRRYFEDTQVPEGHPRFLNGEAHGQFSADEIEALLTDNYWYRPGPPDALKAAQRPKILIVTVFHGTGEVVVDRSFLDDLKAEYPDGQLPVLFNFVEENEVPISYFGSSPTMNDLITAYAERGIVPAAVPMWFAGDRHIDVHPNAVADLVGAPPAGDIPPARMQALQNDIRNGGLNLKPVNLTLSPGSGTPAVDNPERLRAAAAMGLDSVPVMMTFYTDASHASHCGLPPPVGAVGALGSSNANNATTTGPDIPPEIELPNPPEVEPPASGN